MERTRSDDLKTDDVGLEHTGWRGEWQAERRGSDLITLLTDASLCLAGVFLDPASEISL